MGTNRWLTRSYDSPQDALIIYSTETGLIQEVVVKNVVGAADYESKKTILKLYDITITDYKNWLIMPGKISHLTQ